MHHLNRMNVEEYAHSAGQEEREEHNAMTDYGARRGALAKEMLEDSLLVIYSGRGVPASLDEEYPFEANRHFFYLTGLRRENMAIALTTVSGRTRETLFIEEPKPEMERWTGKRVTVEEARAVSGVQDVRFIDALDDFISRTAVREGIANAYFDCYRNHCADPDSYNMAKARAFAAAYPAARLIDAHPLLARMRMVKDEAEIAALRRAIELTHVGLRRMTAALAPGQMEYQAQTEFEYAIRMAGAEGTAFQTIAGSGANGCMLHYGENSARMEDGALLLVDLGAKFAGYCADISRTYPVNGRFTPRQREIYDIVLAANRAVARAARPGVTLRELNDLCKRTLAEGMLRLGKIASAEEIGTYYMHGVSHHLGLDTHDAAADEHLPLRAGMVITDEPGLYVDEEAIGIRIEDDLLITEDGCEVLSEAIERTPEDIEAMMAAK